jgi:hypothetical protein
MEYFAAKLLKLAGSLELDAFVEDHARDESYERGVVISTSKLSSKEIEDLKTSIKNIMWKRKHKICEENEEVHTISVYLFKPAKKTSSEVLTNVSTRVSTVSTKKLEYENAKLLKQIKKMKKALVKESGHDLNFVVCDACDDITIHYGPGGTFTANGWTYCRYCGCNKFWCGRCDAKWTENGDKCKKCTRDE